MNVPPRDAITQDDCWRLLATQHVGRLALSVKALPAILPVQYYVSGGQLAVCLGHRQLPSTSVDGAITAFAADAVDPVTRSGWSVQVLGMSRLWPQRDFEADCDPATEAQVITIEPTRLTGLWVELCPFIAAMQTKDT